MAISTTVDGSNLRSGSWAWLTYLGVCVIILGDVYLQRFAFRVGDGFFPFCFISTYVGLYFVVISGVNSSKVRVTLFSVAFAVIVLDLFIGWRPFSIMSILSLIVTYIPFLFMARIEEDEYKRYLAIFQMAMLPIVAIALLQIVTQDPWDPIKEKFRSIMLENYNTRPQLETGSDFRKSDGLFLLEPSFLSQYMATAVLIELLYFGRRWRVAAYLAGLASAVSLTGVLMMSVFGVVYVWKHKKMPHLIAVVAVVAALMAAYSDTEVVGSVIGRYDELGSTQSSGFNRFVGPWYQVQEQLNGTDQWLFGLGPGSSSNERLNGIPIGGTLWAVHKLTVEYGLLGMLTFTAFTLHCFFYRPQNYILAGALFLLYSALSGSLLQPHTVYLCLVLTCLFPRRRPEDDAFEMNRLGQKIT